MSVQDDPNNEVIYKCSPSCGCDTVVYRLKNTGKLMFVSKVVDEPEELRFLSADGFLNGEWSILPDAEPIIRKALSIRELGF